MSVTLARLRNTVTALAVLMLGMVVITGPASAAGEELPAGFYLCHATGSASSLEDVKSWVSTEPSDAGQAQGHAGDAHQSGLDIIPPIPGALPQGQNWTAYGQRVHAVACSVPVDPDVTFADGDCVSGRYVAPSVSAPTYTGLTRATTGTVAPGSTYTVTYTAKQGHGIVGPGSFTHTFQAFPAGQADCDQPQPEIRRVPGSSSSCAAPAGLTTWVDVYTTPYVWNADQRRWVLGQESAPVRTDRTVTAYIDQQYFEACADERPDAKQRRVPDSEPGCDPGGVTSWVDVWTTEYVWDRGEREWVLGQETGPVRAEEVFTPYGDEEFFEKCADERPDAEQRRVSRSEPSCDLGGVTSWTDVFTTAYVWDRGEREWVRGEETGPVRSGESFTAYTDEDYRSACGDEEPAPEVRQVPMSEPGCDPAGVTSWTDVYSTPYQWSTQTRDWVLGEETGPVRVGESFAAFTDEEFFEACAGDQPYAEQRRVPVSEPSCDLGGVSSWLDVWTTAYVWDLGQREWVRGEETGPVRSAEEFMPYTDEEFFEACASERPDAEQRRVPVSEPSCDPAGVTSWTEVWTTEYVWDEELRDWVLGQETGPVRSGESFTDYTDEEFFEKCADERPDAEQRRVSRSEPSCDLGGVTSWTDVFTTAYVWDRGEREWVRGEETGPVRSGESFTAYTDEEFFEACAGDQPDAEQRRVPRSDPSCRLGGVTSWTDVFTTAYVWDDELRDWVRGEETGPVRRGEEFVPYTAAEYVKACVDIEGAEEEEDKDPARGAELVPQDEVATEFVPWDEVEVGGESQDAAVPTVVAAGRGTGALGSDGDRPWLFALGGALLTLGFAGTRRRATARR